MAKTLLGTVKKSLDKAVERKRLQAYHGTPHDVDKFSMDKIGTGEGAQAYGHGLYFAENPKVGKQYMDDLSGFQEIDGKKVGGGYDDTNNNFEEGTLEYEISKRLDLGQSISEAKEAIKNETPQLIENAKLFGNDTSSLEKILNNVDDFDESRVTTNTGNFYKVELDIDPDTEMLDWDLPLSEQSDFVQNAIEKSGIKLDEVAKGQTGKDFYQSSARARRKETGEPFMQAGSEPSRILNEIGIKGIRYDDGFSRGKEGGTKNFVVFDDSLISIAEKNGIPIEQVDEVAQAQGISRQQALASLIGGGVGLQLLGGSERAEAAGLSSVVKAAGSVDKLKDAAKKANLDPNQIKTNPDGSISYPEEYINPLSDIGAGDVRREVAIHNDEIMGTDTKGEFEPDVTYRGIYGEQNPEKVGNYQMFTSSATDAGEYGNNVIPARIRKGKNLEIEGGANNFNSIPIGQLPDDVRANLHPSIGNVARTDEIAYAARDAGYDSTSIRNLFDKASGEIPRKPVKKASEPSNKDLLEQLLSSDDFNSINWDNVPDAPKQETIPADYNTATIDTVFNQKDVRSPYAAFDPQFKDSSNLLGKSTAKNLAGVAAGTGTVLAAPLAYNALKDPLSDSYNQTMDNIANRERPDHSELAQRSHDRQKTIANTFLNRRAKRGSPRAIDAIASKLRGYEGVAKTIGSGMLNEAQAGLFGIAASLDPTTSVTGSQMINQVQNDADLMYLPKTPEELRELENLQKLIQETTDYWGSGQSGENINQAVQNFKYSQDWLNTQGSKISPEVGAGLATGLGLLPELL